MPILVTAHEDKHIKIFDVLTGLETKIIFFNSPY